MKKFAIYGAGGFGREVLGYLREQISADNDVVFVVDDKYYNPDCCRAMGIPIERFSDFMNHSAGVRMIVAVADPQHRFALIHGMVPDVIHHSLISKHARLYESVIGAGAIVCPGTIVTCNVKIGKFCHLNLDTTIGHDCEIGDYFTTAPGVNISGTCKIGDRVYFGTGSAVRQKISICNDVTIGMGSIVVKDITEPGVYVGAPAKRLR